LWRHDVSHQKQNSHSGRSLLYLTLSIQKTFVDLREVAEIVKAFHSMKGHFILRCICFLL